ncbi:hypothetical protein KY345_01700 [Candidatus Woesearchaeota archaeon]|nr:hypothetical protein [Candidatus Woesearchaeota archaeon]
MLSFFLASLIIGAGVIIGAILSIVAKEELKPGRKYFILLKRLFFSAIILTISIYYFNINYIISLLMLLFLPIIFIKRFQLNLIYIAFAISYILSTINDSLYFIISTLIFFAGFPIGTVATYEFIKKEIFVERKIITAYVLFVLFSSARILFLYLQ